MSDQKKILIVEDEMVTALDIKKYLEDEINIKAEIVTNAIDTIMAVEKEKPDLILMDIMLKGKLNGIDAADIIRKQFQIPLIFITAYQDDETYLNAHLTNPVDIIGKPFSQGELLKKVKSALQINKSDKSKSKEQIL